MKIDPAVKSTILTRRVYTLSLKSFYKIYYTKRRIKVLRHYEVLAKTQNKTTDFKIFLLLTFNFILYEDTSSCYATWRAVPAGSASRNSA